MEIREVDDKEQWERFFDGVEEKTFLQSWNWGKFQEMMRAKIWRLGVFNDDVLVAVALTVKVTARRGTFLLVPHGPVIKISNFPSLTKASAGRQFPISKQILNFKSQILETLLHKLKDIAKEEKASFVRINPIWERNEENKAIFRGLGFRQAPLQMHPEASWKLDITPLENRLLTNMRKTTRYLIRQAAKNPDSKVYQTKDMEGVRVFSKLHEHVSRRQRFTPFSLEYFQNEFEAFAPDREVSMFFGAHRGEVVAASFVVFWSGIGFYHHAASLPQYAKFSIPYLLQWEAITEAKRRGCILYDFWGFVDPKKYPRHPWAGPTLFKMGFAGKAYEYIKTQDLPLRWQYWATAFFEKIRKVRRHL